MAEGRLDLSSIGATLPIIRQSRHAQGSVTTDGDSRHTAMEIDPFIPDQWTLDAESANYLRNLKRKYNGNKHARRVRATQTWIKAKSSQLQPYQRDRLQAGAPIEDVLPGYSAADDEDGYFLTERIGKAQDLAFQSCLREHIRFLCQQPSSLIAFPNGVVTEARRKHYEENRSNTQARDMGCTADECCPDLDSTPASPWNKSFISAVAKDFVSKVRENWYIEHDLPRQALNEKIVKERLKVCLQSMVRSEKRSKKLNTSEKILFAQMHDKYMERRRAKHRYRMKICDETPRFQKYFALLKAIGPEGNSDEETDTEAGTVPPPNQSLPTQMEVPEIREALAHAR